MTISTFTELKSAITTWMDRSEISGSAADFVTLAEAGLNRKLEVVETDVTLTGTLDSRSIDVSAYSVIEPLALFIVIGATEYELTKKAEGTFPQTTTSGEPAIWALDGTNIDFDCPLGQAYSFRFRYQGRFALSDAAPTNDLLTNHPDVYLAACIIWGGLYIRDRDTVIGFKTLLDEFVRDTKTHIAQKKRSVLTVDPALSAMTASSRVYYNGN